MEYYTSYFQMMKSYTLKYNDQLFNILLQYFYDNLDDCINEYDITARNKLDVIIDVTQYYLKLRGFTLDEDDGCLMCGS